MVLVGTDDPDLRVDVDEFVMSMAAALDIRSDQPWVEVTNGKNFTRAVVNAFSDRLDSIRLAHASMTATTSERAHRALYGESLMQIAKQLGMVAADGDEPMGYEVRFQPVMTLQGRALVGYEALVRGQTPQGTIDADELIRRAEAKNSLRELDQLSRSLSMRGVGPWLGEGLLFLNVAAPNGAFDLDAIFATIDQAEAGGLAPDQLVFEAVERNRYHDLDEAAEQVHAIRARGARIAMDDTGDGYASLRVMAAFSPDIVKICGQLVRDLRSSSAQTVIRTVVDLAHQTGAYVVGEGIENYDQLRLLRRLGVDWGQGHFLGAPTAALSGADRKKQ